MTCMKSFQNDRITGQLPIKQVRGRFHLSTIVTKWIVGDTPDANKILLLENSDPVSMGKYSYERLS